MGSPLRATLLPGSDHPRLFEIPLAEHFVGCCERINGYSARAPRLPIRVDSDWHMVIRYLSDERRFPQESDASKFNLQNDGSSGYSLRASEI